MKAKEYYEKYKKTIMDAVADLDYEFLELRMEDASTYLFYAMTREVEEIIKQRRCTMPNAKLAVMREMNVRWNCVRDMVANDLPSGAPNPIKKDGFVNRFIKDGYTQPWREEAKELEKAKQKQKGKVKKS